MIAAVLRALAFLVALFPFAWLRALACPVAVLFGGVLRVRRGHVTGAALRAGVADAGGVARSMYRGLSTGILELLWLAGRPAGSLAAVCSLAADSQRRLDEALAGGKGAVLAASHTGNWELAACAMARALDLLVVVKPLSVRGVDTFMRRAREAHGLRLADPEGALVPARATLARGGCVAMLVDQVPADARHAVAVEFLGAPAWADRSAASLSACSGAPLVLVAFLREPDGSHAVRVLDVLYPPASDRRAFIEPATRSATAALEGFVREHPGEWLWLHRRWKPVRRAPCRTPSSSPAGASRAASSSAPESTRTPPRPSRPSTAPARRSSPSRSGASI